MATSVSLPAAGHGRAEHRPPLRLVLVLTGLPLVTGAALVAFIVFGVPLPIAAGVLATAAVPAWALVLPALSRDQRHSLRDRVLAGGRAGIAGLLAYDATRYGVVALASLSFEPFHIFARFGQALLGPATAEPLASAAGATFHVANGLGFAVAFAMAVPRPGIRAGVLWALCLEAAMLLMYPSWLGVSITGELLPVSLAGHVAYGTAIGVVTRRAIA